MREVNHTIIVARLFSGIFCATHVVCAMAFISDHTDGNQRVRHMSYYAAVVSVCSATGYLIGGFGGIFQAARLLGTGRYALAERAFHADAAYGSQKVYHRCFSDVLCFCNLRRYCRKYGGFRAAEHTRADL